MIRFLAVVLLTFASADLVAEDKPAPRAARSVHLWYKAPPATLFQNELTVEESQNGSYFMACGFRHGYFGMQQLSSENKKVVLFSVWDPGKQNDPNSVEQQRRVKVLFQADDVEVKRFGGEGTGAQCFFRYNWNLGERCRFAIRSNSTEKTTAYSAFFYLSRRKEWKHLATFETQTGGDAIHGYYSFVEDFRRDGKSPHERRSAVFSNGWVRTKEGHWIALADVTFTADQTPLSNINAEVADDGFRLVTGGETKQETDLRSKLSRSPTGEAVPEPEKSP